MPKSKANVSKTFDNRMRELRAYAAGAARAIASGVPQPQYRPGDLDGGWDGDLYNLEGISVPFSRQQSNDEFVEAVKDARDPGTSGDLIVTTTQIDYLACMERAYRARVTMRRSRALAHVVGRLRGHGLDSGPFIQCGLEYVRSVLRQAKAG